MGLCGGLPQRMSCLVAEPQKNKYAMTNMEVRQYMSKEDDVFNRIFLYIEDHLTEKLTVEEIARQVYLSPTYLQSVFKENFGIPLAEYVRSQKL